MFNLTKIAPMCVLGLGMACACLAQSGSKSGEAAKFYRFDFVVKELESGKVVNTRTYSTSASDREGRTCSIRTGNKVPVPTAQGPETSQYTYIDVGVNVDCQGLREVDGQLALTLTAEISSAVGSTRPPMIRQTKWNADVIVPLKKPTTIFTSDDVTGKGQMQLELTATPIK
jgi:hypothetical protein